MGESEILQRFSFPLENKKICFWQVVAGNPCINTLGVQELFPDTFHLECLIQGLGID